jgi:hypothetical protein
MVSRPEKWTTSKDALRLLRRAYGTTPAASFGPVALKSVRKAMIDSGLARNTVNARVGKIRRMFKWAVADELVPPAVLQGLQSVGGLRSDRGGVKETAPIRPVTSLRTGEIDRSGDIWVYRPAHHITQEKGFARAIPIGPKAQTIHRWLNPGVLDVSGVWQRLAMTRVGGRWCVTGDALALFFEALAAEPGEGRTQDLVTPKSRQIAAERTARALDAIGI